MSETAIYSQLVLDRQYHPTVGFLKPAVQGSAPVVYGPALAAAIEVRDRLDAQMATYIGGPGKHRPRLSDKTRRNLNLTAGVACIAIGLAAWVAAIIWIAS